MKDGSITGFADGNAVSAAVQSILRTADALSDDGSWEGIGRNIMAGIAHGILSGTDFPGGTAERTGQHTEQGRRTEEVPGGSVTQNIYLRDSDASPYRTARRIRRESEAIFRN